LSINRLGDGETRAYGLDIYSIPAAQNGFFLNKICSKNACFAPQVLERFVISEVHIYCIHVQYKNQWRFLRKPNERRAQHLAAT
jgi:hypothetical protein